MYMIVDNNPGETIHLQTNIQGRIVPYHKGFVALKIQRFNRRES